MGFNSGFKGLKPVHHVAVCRYILRRTSEMPLHVHDYTEKHNDNITEFRLLTLLMYKNQ